MGRKEAGGERNWPISLKNSCLLNTTELPWKNYCPDSATRHEAARVHDGSRPLKADSFPFHSANILSSYLSLTHPLK